MPFATTIDNSILDHFNGKSTWTAPSARYLALSTTTPTKAGGNVTEPSGGSYARKQVLAADMNAASSSATDNANELALAEATGDWGTITHVCWYDAATAGTFLGFKALTTSKSIGTGDTAKFSAGDLDMAMGGT